MADGLQADAVVCESGVSRSAASGDDHQGEVGEVPHPHAAHQCPV